MGGWVGENSNSRCSKKGDDGTRAHESCLAACGCSTDMPLPMPTGSSCRDSTTWYKSQTWRNCGWVGENPDIRCSKKGDDGTRAHESCLAACGCSTDMPLPMPTESSCRDSTTWYKMKTWKN